jgi:hypothetical protein
MEVTVDANGNIISVVPADLQKNPGKLEEMSAEVGRQISEIEKMSAQDLSDDERQKMRGFGSVWGRSLARVVEQSFPWNKIVEGFINKFEMETTKQSWIKPVQGLKRVGWHYPDEEASHAQDGYSLLFMIDASGSMSDREVAKAVGAILSASSNGIKQIYIIAHDSDLADLSKNAALYPQIRACKADKKVLQKYGVLKIPVSEARIHKRKLTKLLTAFAKELPTGGTSHVVPIQSLEKLGFFKKEMTTSKFSGLVMYTDCASDLEELPGVLSAACQRICKKRTVPAVVVDSSKTSVYAHPIWPTVSVGGNVSNPKKAEKSRKRSR